MAYLRRIAPRALGWALLGIVAVLASHPSRAKLMLSGTVEWWRLASFILFSLFLGFSVAALQDWRIAYGCLSVLLLMACLGVAFHFAELPTKRVVVNAP
jgi:hypothetical protein